MTLAWQPVQLIDGALAQTYLPSRAPIDGGLVLPGKLHEHVQMTPGGRRCHTFKHTSPGGTLRVRHYSSPARAPQLLREHRSKWPAWRLDLVREHRHAHKAEREAAREATRKAVIAEGGLGRTSTHKRCGACASCLAPRKNHRIRCLTVLAKLQYTERERERLAHLLC